MVARAEDDELPALDAAVLGPRGAPPGRAGVWSPTASTKLGEPVDCIQGDPSAPPPNESSGRAVSAADRSAGRLPWRPGHFRLGQQSGTLRRVLRSRRLRGAAIPNLVGLIALAALVVGIDPGKLAQAVTHFHLAVIPAVVVLSLGYYVLQGVRWDLLLSAVGVHLRMRDTVTLNVAGQATALLPLGELTRAVFVTEASGAEFGSVVATVTVQELLYTLILIILAAPGLLALHAAAPGIAAALLLTGLIFLSLTWCPAYRRLRWLVAHTPLLRRIVDEVDALHNDTTLLMRKPGTLGWSWLSVAGAASTVTVFWLIAGALSPGTLSWTQAAYVYALSNIAGALSLIPGGIGAYEASVAGLLVAAGMDPATAGAVALVQRVADKGLATMLGIGTYMVARHHYPITGLGSLRAHAVSSRAEDMEGATAAAL